MAVEIDVPGPVPREAIDFFAGKQLKPGFDYRDVWREEHSYSFTVAKATELDVLTAIQDELMLAISNGKTLAQFQKALKPRLQEMGWWGRQEMTDPLTGERKQVQLGSPRRLKVIYDANLRTAHAAGQWQRAERTKEALPYLLRTLGPSREHRAEHVAWHGTMLPIDDPWWDTHMPPNGYQCKCRVRQVSQGEYQRLIDKGVPAADRRQIIDPGFEVLTGHKTRERQPPILKAPPIEYREWTNRRTGEIERVPLGIDPGWDTNPGKDRQKGLKRMMAGKLKGVDPAMAAAAERDLAAYQARFGDNAKNGL